MKFSDIEDALDFVSSVPYGEHSAIICTTTGDIYYSSIYGDIADELPEEEFDPHIHIKVPHKNALNLGYELVYEFVTHALPEEEGLVRSIFRKRGAYGQFKHMLDTKHLLEEWYAFEEQRVNTVLRKWCEDHGISLSD